MAFIRPPNGILITNAQQFAEGASRLAVVLFFVLSGFVIAKSLFDNRALNGQLVLHRYALARSFRILPPLLLSIAISWVCYQVLLVSGWYFLTLLTAERVAYVVTLDQQAIALLTLGALGDLAGEMQFNGPLWSLQIEIRLYVIAGLIAGTVWAASWRARVSCAAFLLLYLWTIDAHILWDSRWGYRQPVMFTAFALGALSFLSKSKMKTSRTAVAVAISSIALMLGIGAQLDQPRRYDFTALWASFQVMSACAFAVMLPVLSNWRAPRALAKLGGMSYTLYIAHFAVMQFFYFLLFHNAPALVRNSALTPATAVVIGVATFAICSILAKAERPKEQAQQFFRCVEALRTSLGRPGRGSV